MVYKAVRFLTDTNIKSRASFILIIKFINLRNYRFSHMLEVCKKGGLQFYQEHLTSFSDSYTCGFENNDMRNQQLMISEVIIELFYVDSVEFSRTLDFALERQ